MSTLIYKLNIQLFADDPAGDKDKDKDPNTLLLLDKVKDLEKRLDDANKKIDAVTEFNRKLLDGAKPDDTKKADSDVSKRFENYLNEERRH